MIITNIVEKDEFIEITYNTTWKLTYEIILEFVQALIDLDFEKNIYRFYGDFNLGPEPIDILEELKYVNFDVHKSTTAIIDGEQLGISGYSKAMNTNLEMIFFNSSRRVKVIYSKQSDLIYHGPNALDNFMNSIEITAYVYDAKRKNFC